MYLVESKISAIRGVYDKFSFPESMVKIKEQDLLKYERLKIKLIDIIGNISK